MTESSFLTMMIGNLVSPIFFALVNPAILALKNRKILRLFQSIVFYFLLGALSLIRSLPFNYYYSPSSATSTRREGQRSRVGGKTTTVATDHPPAAADADASVPAVSRALAQLLSSMSYIPVSSRKYDMVRSLAEKLIEENCLDGLDQLSSQAISVAFSDTLRRLKRILAAASVDTAAEGGGIRSGLRRIVIRSGLARRVGKWSRDLATRSLRPRGEEEIVVPSVGAAPMVVEDDQEALAAKLMAELLWLAERWVACGGALAVLDNWGSASGLARISLSTWPRIQGGLVKLTAFLIKQARELRPKEDEKSRDMISGQEQQQMLMDRIKVRMLVSWLPLLCRGINGTDTPILSTSERAELERALEEMIDSLAEYGDRERVLSTWLRHFVLCSTSDWPDLHASYLRWCSESRKLYLKTNDIYN